MNTDKPLMTTVQHELRMRRLVVNEVMQPTPHLVRVTLGGPEMDGFISLGASDHVKIFFPANGSTDADLPELGPNGLKLTPGAPRLRGRDYTPKHDRLEDGKLVIDIVVHDHGTASDWARRARVGDTLGVAGPRGSRVLDETIDTIVLFGDETALPAITNFLAKTSPTQHVQAHIEIMDEHDVQPIATTPGHSIAWHHRNGDPPGRSNVLLGAARAIELAQHRVFYWIATEATIATRVRHCLIERGANPATVESRGYWKLATQEHQEPHGD